MEGAPTFDLLAASLRADARDLAGFVEALAVKLQGAFPDQVQVDRKGRLFGEKHVRALRARIAEHEYELESGGSIPTARRRTVVRGVTVKNEELGLDEWIDSLSADLLEEAQRGERARLAVERLLT